MPVWIDGGPRRSLRRRVVRAAAVTAVAGLAIGGALGGAPSDPTAVADAHATVTFVGSGNGHGRGMGQWGAFGYATRGWSAERILDHYYGDTTMGRVRLDTPVTVRLSKLHGVYVYAAAGAKVAGQRVGPGTAVLLDGTRAVVTRGCGGPVVRTIADPDQTVHPVDAGRSRPADEILHFCGRGLAYRGSLALQGGHVYNIVDIEDYVRGVVPAESPATWADQGGYQALRAQAVAARSYALATAPARGTRFDDTQASQVYDGYSHEDPRTDRAVADTAGLVRKRDGRVIATEFSASTGGYTAGGVFPAVPDAGDVVSPYRDWTATVPAAEIGTDFGIGSLRSIAVTRVQATGVPRAEEVLLVGTRGTKTVTGDDLRSKLKLKSDMFVIEHAPGAGRPVPVQPAPVTAPLEP
ncbi:SpoIID/LytB domain-containing protein [Tsukamurella soli]|uniref:Sporulation stage II protein D amidase enhancer LytB N-terminal domain-containing protein n=1 Tax=Tsukamurella soli TaxID=644556 RepID=A0ABP8J711_9ACTN